jgi:glycosyltransferase involved in cell wall biosynthesis
MTAFCPDLIFVSLENWDDVWRRNQFLCAGLARRDPEAKILFVGLAKDVSHDLRCGNWDDLRPEPAYTVPDHPGITVMRPLKLLPSSLPLGRKTNEAVMRCQVRRTARAMGLRRPLLWLNPHGAAHMAGRMGERGVIYDVTDDWISPVQSDRMRRLTIAQDAILCRRADTVIVCSRKLYEMKRPLARSLALVPNGVETEHYRTVMDRAEPMPEESARWRRPVFGYTGTIHPERVDVGLVETLARAFPGGTVVLVGPDLLSPTDHARLVACGNVALTGSVSYRRLPEYMRAFDVCITPHCMSEFTESLNPIKLWEYLASGKPVVSTDVAGFRDYAHLLHVERDPKCFVAACAEALSEPEERGRLRMAEAGKHTWSARVDQVMSILQSIGEAA